MIFYGWFEIVQFCLFIYIFGVAMACRPRPRIFIYIFTIHIRVTYKDVHIYRNKSLDLLCFYHLYYTRNWLFFSSSLILLYNITSLTIR